MYETFVQVRRLKPVDNFVWLPIYSIVNTSFDPECIYMFVYNEMQKPLYSVKQTGSQVPTSWTCQSTHHQAHQKYTPEIWMPPYFRHTAVFPTVSTLGGSTVLVILLYQQSFQSSRVWSFLRGVQISRGTIFYSNKVWSHFQAVHITSSSRKLGGERNLLMRFLYLTLNWYQFAVNSKMLIP